MRSSTPPLRFASIRRPRALGVWLHRRRQDAGQGVLSPIYKQGLSVIPGSDKASNRKVDDETRWQQRLTELEEYLGVWLHVRRMKHRRDQLDRIKEETLNNVVAGVKAGYEAEGSSKQFDGLF